jgi:hypothetical protein
MPGATIPSSLVTKIKGFIWIFFCATKVAKCSILGFKF